MKMRALILAGVSLAVAAFAGESTGELRAKADGGSAEAQFKLGEILFDSDDKGQAVKYWTRAAEQGHVEAQLQLAIALTEVQSAIPNDFKAAAKWFRQAAAQGNRHAQFQLGLLYAEGQGVPQDLVLAQAWWNIARSQGSESAKVQLPGLEAKMTPEQRAEAMKTATALFAEIERNEQLAGEARRKAATGGDQPENAGRPKVESERPSVTSAGGKSTDEIDPQRPRPAVVKQRQVRPAILAERLAGTPHIRPTAVDARWNVHAAYLMRMIESVQIQWERLVAESKVQPASGSAVSVKFILNSKGEIAKVVKVESTANTATSRASVNALTGRVSYGLWTDAMKATLGEQQEMTFTFYYQ
ncbi:MAG: tetratricopeptide repeat protein [Verrucomicrobia bacterium]|nr:tetratricopeptide repeat protein [Verrucomicrobiota bacterium]